MEKNKTMEDTKIAFIYGSKKVDGKNKEGHIEFIYKDDDEYDVAHFFYMKEFLKDHFITEPSVQDSLNKSDVNSIFFEIQKLGHIVFAENTSLPQYKTGVLYIPKSITTIQMKTLEMFRQQLQKKDYTVTVLSNLFRDPERRLFNGTTKNIKSRKFNIFN